MKRDVESLNKYSNIILSQLLHQSTLSNTGETVNGQVYNSEPKLWIIINCKNILDTRDLNWGNILDNGVSVDEFNEVEDFYKFLKYHLKKNNILEEDWGTIGFTKSGYLLAKKMEESKKPIHPFSKDYLKSLKIKSDSPTNIINYKSLPDEVTNDLKRFFLAKLYEYHKEYNRKIFFSELAIRFISDYFPEFKTVNSIYKYYETENEYSKIINDLKSISLICYRENLIDYDHRNRQWLEIKKGGIAFLVDDEESKLQLKSKPEIKLEKITIIHISDLHFGSQEDVGIDNKSQLTNLDNFFSSNFNLLKEKIDTISTEKFLVISGDITSKNEEGGFIKCIDELQKLNISDESIYVVPGNHDCDRESISGDKFSLFLHNFSEYYNPFIRTKFILNKELKLFVYGFNSIHNAKNQKGEVIEIFGIDEQSITLFKETMRKLNNEFDNFNEYYKIAVFHNNLIEHPYNEIREYGNFINSFKIKQILMANKFNMVLSGHKHQSLVERHTMYIDNFIGDINIISAGSLSGKVTNGYNAFNIIEIEREIETGKPFYINVIEMVKRNLDTFEHNNIYKINLGEHQNIEFRDAT